MVAVVTFQRKDNVGKLFHQPPASEFGAGALQGPQKLHCSENKFVVPFANNSHVICDDPRRTLPAPIGRPKWVLAEAILNLNCGHRAISQIDLPRAASERRTMITQRGAK